MDGQSLFHFLPGSRCLVVETAGTFLGFRYSTDFGLTLPEAITRTLAASPDDLVNAALRNHCLSVVLKPEAFAAPEYLIDTAQKCHASGIKVAVKTSGYVDLPALEHFLPQVDAVSVRLEAFNETFYRQVCGAQLAPVLDTLVAIHRWPHVWLEVDYHVVPGENDGRREIEALTLWLASHIGADTPIHFVPFRPQWLISDRMPASPGSLIEAQWIARENGMHHVYAADPRIEHGVDTLCVSCRRTLIRRRPDGVQDISLDSRGRCDDCGQTCAGVFRTALEGSHDLARAI